MNSQLKTWLKKRTILHEHDNKCIGIKLFSSSRYFVQLWYCPANYEIEPHSHDKEDIELMFIYGAGTFFKRTKEEWMGFKIVKAFTPKFYHIFRCFSVPAKTVHWFSVNSKPLIFINFSKFQKGVKPVSAAEDFNKTIS